MSEQSHYPASPSDIPESLTKAKSSYKRQAWLAMLGLLSFIVIYIALTICFAYIAYVSATNLQTGKFHLSDMLFVVISSLLTVFMVKSLFTIRKSGNPGGVEVTIEDEPKLFEFLHTLADEIGAPKPHRVFITPEVNAAVFYDLSLMNLIFPSKKNLIVGLGLVNVLNLGELKAVLAHEFGHFAQGSMAVGRWVYVAQQIIAHMVATRGWLDSVVRFISRIDIRIAWVGWILGLIIWSIRSMMDTLFSLVIIAERALSREMEFNADLVAVSVTGSDALVNALHKLQSADEAWQTTLDVVNRQAAEGKRIEDFFSAQKEAVRAIGKVLNDENYGVVPEANGTDAKAHRVFSEQSARPPQMWSTHPANRDREDNAKNVYIASDIDQRSAWLVFADPDKLKQQISLSFYNKEKVNDLSAVPADDAVNQRFGNMSYSPEYRGAYLSRSTVRDFSSVEEILQSADISESAALDLANLYPESLAEVLERARSLDAEKSTLQALASGDLKPSGGVIRHRGEELKKAEIPDAIEEISKERKEVADKLKVHDGNCRKAHLLAAKNLGGEWEVYLLSLLKLLHCAEHLRAVTSNEQALLVNTWQVITADGQIGYFEKRRMLNVCKQTQQTIRAVSQSASQIMLPDSLAKIMNIESWPHQCPQFDIDDVTPKNWPNWCQAASQMIDNLSYALGALQATALEELVKTEANIANYINSSERAEEAPKPGVVPKDYPTLLTGHEHVLQRKLDLWNRFQLAQGVFPTTLRLIVSLCIVVGTIYGGFVGFNI